MYVELPPGFQLLLLGVVPMHYKLVSESHLLHTRRVLRMHLHLQLYSHISGGNKVHLLMCGELCNLLHLACKSVCKNPAEALHTYLGECSNDTAGQQPGLDTLGLVLDMPGLD